MQPPGILVFRTDFFCEIIHGYVFGVKESNGDSWNFLSLLRDLETQGHCPLYVTVEPLHDLHFQGHGVAP